MSASFIGLLVDLFVLWSISFYGPLYRLSLFIGLLFCLYLPVLFTPFFIFIDLFFILAFSCLGLCFCLYAFSFYRPLSLFFSGLLVFRSFLFKGIFLCIGFFFVYFFQTVSFNKPVPFRSLYRPFLF